MHSPTGLALQGDLMHVSPDEMTRDTADDRMALLTPVVKGYLTDKGFRSASDALQLHGGAGYTREQGVEQFVRDARIAHDLRRHQRHPGAGSGRAQAGQQWRSGGVPGSSPTWRSSARPTSSARSMKPFVAGLQTAEAQLKEATMWLMQNGMSNFDNAGASSHDYLHLFGLAMLALMWARDGRRGAAKEGDGRHFL